MSKELAEKFSILLFWFMAVVVGTFGAYIIMTTR
jgi:hypothetical protein